MLATAKALAENHATPLDALVAAVERLTDLAAVQSRHFKRPGARKTYLIFPNDKVKYRVHLSSACRPMSWP